MKKLFLVSVLSLVVPCPAAQPQETQRQKGRVLTQQGKLAGTPTPASKSQKVISNGKGKMPPYGKEVVTTPTAGGKRTPDASKKSTPAPKVDSINLNSSRSNTYRIRPTLTPTASKSGIPPSAGPR
jgi:hypothetical protein